MPAPFTEDELRTSITKIIITLKDGDISEFSNKITTLILQELKPKTLDYKIIINSTTVGKDIKDDVKESAGFLFTESTDGYYTLKFEDVVDGYDLILTIVYIK